MTGDLLRRLAAPVRARLMRHPRVVVSPPEVMQLIILVGDPALVDVWESDVEMPDSFRPVIAKAQSLREAMAVMPYDKGDPNWYVRLTG